MTVSSYSLGSQEPSGAAAVPSATVTIGEIPIFAGTANDAVRSCLDLIRSGSGGRVATANLDFLALARKDPQLRADLAASTLVVADGMPVVWLGKLAGARDIQRIAGVDLVGELFMAIEAKLHGTRTNRSLYLFTHADMYYYRARRRKTLSTM